MICPEEEQKFDDVYTTKFLPRLFAKANDDVISILLNQVKNERSLLNLDRDKISLFRWLIELLGHVARSVNRDSIGVSAFEKRVTLMHTHSLIVKFLNDTQMVSELSNERIALMEASMYVCVCELSSSSLKHTLLLFQVHDSTICSNKSFMFQWIHTRIGSAVSHLASGLSR